MPVEFLSDEQAARYGRYHADPSPEQLTRFFYLSAADKQFLAARRLPHTRLGCAVQLGTLRFLGTFLVDPLQVPAVVVQTLASQLGLAAEQLAPYRDRLNTGYEHQPLIQAYLQYQSFDGRQAFRLTPLEVLRTAPTRVSAPALVAALRRLDQIRALG